MYCKSVDKLSQVHLVQLQKKFCYIVTHGYTLLQPDDCPEDIFNIMRSCWKMSVSAYLLLFFNRVAMERKRSRETVKINNWPSMSSNGSLLDVLESITRRDLEQQNKVA